MANEKKSRALAFKEKYSPITDLPPEEVGKAIIMQAVYLKLKKPGEQLPDFYTPEEWNVLKDKLTTKKLRERYTAYRQFREWLLTRATQTAIESSLIGANLDMAVKRILVVMYTEGAEAALEEDGIKAPDAFSELYGMNANSEKAIARERDNITYALYQIKCYNKLLAMLGWEIKLPELIHSFGFDYSPMEARIQKTNWLIEQVETYTHKKYDDDGGAGTARRKAIDAIQLYDTPDEVPDENVKAARKLIKGLCVFSDPMGGTLLDQTIRGNIRI